MEKINTYTWVIIVQCLMSYNSSIAPSLVLDMGEVRRAELLSKFGLFSNRGIFLVPAMFINKGNWFMDQEVFS